MTPETYQLASDWFAEALDLPELSRRGYLDGRAASDPIAAEHARELLTWHSAAPDFLDPAALAFPLIEEPRFGATIADRYRLLGELGRGGSGVVYLAADERLHDRPVALKLLHDLWFDPARRDSAFLREVHALSSLRHPAIVDIYDAGSDASDGRPYLAMEYVPGPTLRQRLATGPLPPETALDCLAQLASALDAAHDSGVLHLDLKPENILLGESGVRITDFGIARPLQAQASASTLTAHFMGTAAYMAPEHFRGKPVAASDLYALGVIAYELFSGRRPFESDTPFALLSLQESSRPTPLHTLNPAIPRPLSLSVQRMLSLHAGSRYASATAFVTALRTAWAHGVHWHHALPSRRRLALAAPLLLAPGGWWLHSQRPLSESERSVVFSGPEDPVFEGFIKRLDVNGFIEPNPARNGWDGFRVATRNQGYYYRPLSKRHKRQAIERGWRLRTRMECIDGAIFTNVDFAGFAPRFDIAIFRKDGRLTTRLWTQSAPEWQGHDFVLDLPTPTHVPLLELVFDPATRTAAFFVDGAERFRGYRGNPQYQEDRGLFFGVQVYRTPRAEGILRGASLLINA